MTKKLDFEGIYWHQRWEITPGVITPGKNDVGQLLRLVQLPDRLDGKRVLDIGSWNGCFSFECEKRGAAQVIAIGPENPDLTGFNMLREYLDSKVVYQYGSIYDLDPKVMGLFDIVLCFGVLYHLRYPLLGLDNCRRVARKDLYVESACIDHDLIIDGKARDLSDVNPSLARAALMQFYRRNELNSDDSNWFSPNEKCLRDMLYSSGFDELSIVASGVRILAHAQVKAGYPEFLSIGSGEAVYYDIFVSKLFGGKEHWVR